MRLGRRWTEFLTPLLDDLTLKTQLNSQPLYFLISEMGYINLSSPRSLSRDKNFSDIVYLVMTSGNTSGEIGKWDKEGKEAHRRCGIEQTITVSEWGSMALKSSGRNCNTWPWVAPPEEKAAGIFILCTVPIHPSPANLWQSLTDLSTVPMVLPFQECHI